MNASELSALLQRLNACKEARNWADGKSLEEAWNTCERGDWMLWLCGKMIGKTGWPSRQELVLAACACAELSLPYIPDGEDRPRKCIEVTRAWAHGKASLEQVKNAAHPAYAAHAAASAAYAARAAASAAHAAYAAHAAASAAHAAAYAAHAAAYAAYAAHAAASAAADSAANSAAHAAASAAHAAASAAYAAARAAYPALAAASAARAAARKQTLKTCADIARKMLKVPEGNK